MKVGKPSGNDVKNAASVAGGVVVGSAVSNGVFSVIHDEEKAIADAAEKKKHDNMGLLKRGALVVVGGGLGAAIKSNDVVSLLVKGVCYGIAGQQGYAIVKSLAGKSTAVQKMAASGDKLQRAIAKSVGLGCACGDKVQAYPAYPMNGRRKKRGMGMIMPAIGAYSDMAPSGRFGESANAFDNAIGTGQALVAL
ncbi:hypothetical protein MH928_17295 [Flavobacterium sp. WW92]|uniref:hypothetical protein n=1 Tax=unclassified Flavobacterium TaxID=196869 RepID=UPI002224F809|nr:MULTISPECIES: hypothetical protein [unclassified Flavobacterium]WDO13064.1 hypothetical protein MH928_17295 [Flavobacterium sp. WW92]